MTSISPGAVRTEFSNVSFFQSHQNTVQSVSFIEFSRFCIDWTASMAFSLTLWGVHSPQFQQPSPKSKGWALAYLGGKSGRQNQWLLVQVRYKGDDAKADAVYDGMEPLTAAGGIPWPTTKSSTPHSTLEVLLGLWTVLCSERVHKAASSVLQHISRSLHSPEHRLFCYLSCLKEVKCWRKDCGQ